MSSYINWNEDDELVIPSDVAEAFQQTQTPEFTKTRQRHSWLFTFLSAALNLYGIVPISILARLFNRHKEYTATTLELMTEIKTIPHEFQTYIVEDAVIYDRFILENSQSLLAKQGDKPFYIPASVEEIMTLSKTRIIISPSIKIWQAI